VQILFRLPHEGTVAAVKRTRLSSPQWHFCIALTAVGSGSDDPGIWVDPAKFTLYHCEDLSRRLKELTTRESELRALIEKANESTGGAVIGSVAYRSDYEAF
jgi:hypothetical protein